MTLKELFSKYCPIDIRLKDAKYIQNWCIQFEIDPGFADALQTPLLGVDKIHFKDTHQNSLFNYFNISKNEIRHIAKLASAVDTTRAVSSDPFNLFCMWLLHKVMTSSVPENEQHKTCVAILKMLHYKFFTSVVQHNFPHSANMDVMQATIENMNNKFYVVKYGTWAEVIRIRSIDVCSKDSIHYSTLKNFYPDIDILYVITDVQTRIRTNLVLVVQQYYKNRELGIRNESYDLVGEIDGKKVINNSSNTFDTMISNLSSQIMNVHTLIDDTSLDIVTKLVKNFNKNMLRTALIKYSDLASVQSRKNELDKIVNDGDGELLIGHRILVKNIIQKTYRVCVKERIDMNSKLSILRKAMNIYRSSRISDSDILDIRRSVDRFIDSCNLTQRDSTKTSLKIAFILYFILRSFPYLK